MQPIATEQPGAVARLASSLTGWTERWVPDAFIFALIATVVIVIAGWTATASTFPQVVDSWGRGFWDLIPFTLQMALIIITGQVLATSPPADWKPALHRRDKRSARFAPVHDRVPDGSAAPRNGR